MKHRINSLLREKRINGLEEIVSDKELSLLKKGMPVQKIVGFINFDDVQINVDKNVLIPRYETQELVEYALKFIHKESRVLDLCTGSGYIGLSIKKKTNADVVMSDYSDEAIEQSKENAKLNNLKVDIIKSDMFENITGKFDVILSNPPYIPSNITLDKSVTDFEPEDALFAGIDGNDFYKIIINESKKFLKENSVLIVEMSDDNKTFLVENGFEIIKDINEKNRIAIKQF